MNELEFGQEQGILMLIQLFRPLARLLANEGGHKNESDFSWISKLQRKIGQLRR